MAIRLEQHAGISIWHHVAARRDTAIISTMAYKDKATVQAAEIAALKLHPRRRKMLEWLLQNDSALTVDEAVA